MAVNLPHIYQPPGCVWVHVMVTLTLLRHVLQKIPGRTALCSAVVSRLCA